MRAEFHDQRLLLQSDTYWVSDSISLARINQNWQFANILMDQKLEESFLRVASCQQHVKNSDRICVPPQGCRLETCIWTLLLREDRQSHLCKIDRPGGADVANTGLIIGTGSMRRVHKKTHAPKNQRKKSACP